MPRETVKIDVSSKFRLEAGARFFSTLAYPDAADLRKREDFWRALCRWYVLDKAKDYPGYGRTPHLLVPAIFTATEYDTVRILARGMKNLHHRMTATYWIAIPHFRRKAPKRITIVEKDGPSQRVIPTVNNMSMFAMEQLGWQGKGKSVPTLKSKIWAPSRPVVHATAACLVLQPYMKPVFPFYKDDPFLVCLENPSCVKGIIEQAERFRLMLPSIEQFQIAEEETIQFLAEGTPPESSHESVFLP